MSSITLGIGAYIRPRIELADIANAELSAFIEDAVLTVTGDIGYLMDSSAGFVIFVATKIGTGRIYATLTIEETEVQAYIDIDVTADYDWSIATSNETETPINLRSTVPFAKYSGYNKGIRRPFGADQPNYMEDTLLTLPIAQASNLDILTPLVIVSQEFDISAMHDDITEGWGTSPWGAEGMGDPT